MEHGSIGEARTKGILIDRFWILERSVDINGADFIIQYRDPKIKFTEKNRLRVGIVQSKYIQDEKTNILIRYDYLFDSYRNLLSKFFLFIHTGKEDLQTSYFLTPEDIKDFPITEKDNKKFFRLNKKTIDSNDKDFRIHSIKLTNDIIERVLKRDDLSSTYYQYKAINNLKDIDQIDKKYKYDIWTHYDLIDFIKDIKIDVYKIKETMEDLIYYFDEIISEKDALKVAELAEDLSGDIDYQGRISFKASNLQLNGTAIDCINEYLKTYTIISKLGKLKLFQSIKNKLKAEITKIFLCNSKSFSELKSKSFLEIVLKLVDDDIKISAEIINISNDSKDIIELEKNNNEFKIHLNWNRSRDIEADNSTELNVKNAIWLISEELDGRLIKHFQA